METYRRLFFIAALVLGVYLAVINKQSFDILFSKIDYLIFDLMGDVLGKFPWERRGPWILLPIIFLIAIAFFILFLAFWIIYWLFRAIFWLLCKIYIPYAIIGLILIYPFYFIFINLFELFLLLMIQHPARGEIQKLIGGRGISEGTIGTINERMMAFSDKLPFGLESEIMTKQLRTLSKMIHAEAALLRKLKEKRISEAL